MDLNCHFSCVITLGLFSVDLFSYFALSPADRVSLERQGPEERMVLRGQRVASGPLASSDHLDWLERRYIQFNKDTIT